MARFGAQCVFKRLVTQTTIYCLTNDITNHDQQDEIIILSYDDGGHN